MGTNQQSAMTSLNDNMYAYINIQHTTHPQGGQGWSTKQQQVYHKLTIIKQAIK